MANSEVSIKLKDKDLALKTDKTPPPPPTAVGPKGEAQLEPELHTACCSFTEKSDSEWLWMTLIHLFSIVKIVNLYWDILRPGGSFLLGDRFTCQVVGQEKCVHWIQLVEAPLPIALFFPGQGSQYAAWHMAQLDIWQSYDIFCRCFLSPVFVTGRSQRWSLQLLCSGEDDGNGKGSSTCPRHAGEIQANPRLWSFGYLSQWTWREARRDTLLPACFVHWRLGRPGETASRESRRRRSSVRDGRLVTRRGGYRDAWGTYVACSSRIHNPGPQCVYRCFNMFPNVFLHVSWGSTVFCHLPSVWRRSNSHASPNAKPGEYTALCAAGVMSFEDGLKLVKLRGEAMQEAATSLSCTVRGVYGVWGVRGVRRVSVVRCAVRSGFSGISEYLGIRGFSQHFVGFSRILSLLSFEVW